MATFGTNYGMAELRCAQAVQDAVTYYLVDGTMPNYGTLYGEKEKRLAIAIVENTSIGGGGGSVPDGNKGDVTVSGGGSQWTVNNLPQSRITGLVTNLSNKQDVLVSGVNIKTISGLSLPGSGDLPIATLSGSETLLNKTLPNPKTFYQVFTTSGTTQTIDFNSGSIINLNLASAGGNVTLTLNNPQAATTYLLKVVQGSVPRNLIFPSGTLQAGGGGATYIGSVNQTDIIAILWDGTNYFISVSKNYS